MSETMQGAALAASVLLYHQREHPFESAPFRLAVFFCGSLPYCLGNDCGVDVARLFAAPPSTGFGPPTYITYNPLKDDGSATARPLLERPQKLSIMTDEYTQSPLVGFNLSTMNERQWAELPSAPSTDSESDSASDSAEDAIFSPSEGSESATPISSGYGSDQDPFEMEEKKPGPVSGAVDHVIRRFHASVDKLRIGIPTAHIYGKADPYYGQSLELAKLCDQQWAVSYEHPDGHVVPRDQRVNASIAATIEKAIQMSEICSR